MRENISSPCCVWGYRFELCKTKHAISHTEGEIAEATEEDIKEQLLHELAEWQDLLRVSERELAELELQFDVPLRPDPARLPRCFSPVDWVTICRVADSILFTLKFSDWSYERCMFCVVANLEDSNIEFWDSYNGVDCRSIIRRLKEMPSSQVESFLDAVFYCWCNPPEQFEQLINEIPASDSSSTWREDGF